MKTVCLFSIHRTGTNYLGSVLRQWPAATAFGEIFHPTQGFGIKPAYLRALSKAAGQAFADTKQPDFIAWARAHPAPMVEALRRVAERQGKEVLYFKVFLGQWTVPIGPVIDALARLPGFTPVVLQRRCIDIYVSYRKAEAAGQYKHVDTTGQPVTLEAHRYAHWARQARAWYQGVAGELARAGVAPLRVRYERDIDMPAAALSAHWSRLLGVAAPDTLDDTLALARQDRNDSLDAKVANLAEFRAGLVERGLWEESQGYFLDDPIA